MIPKVKICGIKNIDEVKIMNKYKVDYIGFVFAKSKRRVSKKQAKKLRNQLRDEIKVVGVFVDEDINMINEISDYVGLDIIQLHGKETMEYINKIKKPVWKSIKVKNSNFIDKVNKYLNVDGILLDGAKPGSGKVFDWKLFNNFEINTKLILAGGLNSKNIKSAIDFFNPDIVDVSSGVEKGNEKNDSKISEFLRRIKDE